jgi:hypothetical protein
VALHPRDRLFWREVHGDQLPEIEMEVAPSRWYVTLEVLHTPGLVRFCQHQWHQGAAFQSRPPTGRARTTAVPRFRRAALAIGAELLTLPGRPRAAGPRRGEHDRDAEKRFDSWITAGPGWLVMLPTDQPVLPGMPRRLYPCTPTRLRTWPDCPRRYRMAYRVRPPRRGPPWAQ